MPDNVDGSEERTSEIVSWVIAIVVGGVTAFVSYVSTTPDLKLDISFGFIMTALSYAYAFAERFPTDKAFCFCRKRRRRSCHK